MRFTLNGEEFDTPDGATVSDILRQLKIEPSRVAVEVNMSIIRKSDYPAFQIKAGDKVEVVNFVGGG